MPLVLDQPDNSSNSGGTGILVADLLRRLDNLMTDEDRVRWTQEERIDWVNDAAREIVVRAPRSRAVTRTHDLIAGTFQNGPEGIAQVLDVVRNIKADGKPGLGISLAKRQAIEQADPTWHTRKSGVTRHYMMDDRNPTSFYVWPPAASGAKVEMLVSEPPPVVEAAADILDMRFEFTNAILNWCLYRCHTKDSEYSQGAVAAQHYQAFEAIVGAPYMAAAQNSANANSK